VITHGVQDGVAMITIDRGERRNALDIEHCESIASCILASIDQDARAIVITGTGSAFCAGADFAQVSDAAFRDALYQALGAVAGAPLPVIAAVNGPAIGAGLQLALACDIRVAGPTAQFAIPTARLGLAVDTWTIRRLVSIVGAGAASWILLASEALDAEQARTTGLAQTIGTIDDAARLARDIARSAPLSLAYSKGAIRSAETSGDTTPLSEAFEACWRSADLQEGLRARSENREPRFKGA
jgi:enoyl-CoA hydratase